MKRTGELLKAKVLDYAAFKLKKPAEELDVRENWVVRRANGTRLVSLADLALGLLACLVLAIDLVLVCAMDASITGGAL